MNRLAPALALLLLAGCARSEDASLVPPDSREGYNQVGRIGTPEADDQEPAIGQWRASLQENVQVLEFGPMGTEPLFSLLCTADRSVLLQRHGGAPAGPLPAMHLTIGEVDQRLPITAGGGAIPMLRAEVPLDSPLAQGLAQGGQPLLVRLDDGAPLVIPASPLIADYLQSCAASGPSAAGNTAAQAPASGNSAAPAAGGNQAQPAAPGTNQSAPAGNSTQPEAAR